MEENGNLLQLSKGGVLVQTPIGNIQFGIPSETIKDTMMLEGGVPSVFIVPHYMFDVATGISMADIEFPIYFNFFLKQRKTRIVCTENQKKRLTVVIKEALFGPEEIDITSDYALGEDSPVLPNIRKEMDFFKRKPSDPTQLLELSDVLDFATFDSEQRVQFDNIEIRFDEAINYYIYAKNKLIAAIDREFPIMPRRTESPESDLYFEPPLFGVTTLGAGHGFDPDSNTSGMIIWINRRGIVVDPPVNSTNNLLSLGVSPKLIDSVILTHCHADHDAGTLQKLMQEGKLKLFTTRTVFDSFMRKSSALTGLREVHLRRIIDFHPVLIGEPINIGGGTFSFGHTLHSIPTISVQANFLGKSIIYSSDTLNDPRYLDRLFEEGILSEGRRDFLKNFPWDRTVVFHEAGMPPLHTPMDYLCSLPEDVRHRIYLVHVKQDAIPKESGLRIAPTGLSNTIELDINPLPFDDAIRILDTVSQIDMFRNLTIDKARELLAFSKIERFSNGSVIFREKDPGNKFYIILKGKVDIVSKGKIITTFGKSDFFGEKSLFLKEIRTATAKAKIDTTMITIKKEDMLSFIRGTESQQLLYQIAMYQNEQVRELINTNRILSTLTATQETHFFGLINELTEPFEPGTEIIQEQTMPEKCYMIAAGQVNVYRDDNLLRILKKGDLFGVRNIVHGAIPSNFSFIAKAHVRLFSIEQSSFLQYLSRNPGVYIKFYHYQY